jgi:PKD repeat protein
MLGASRAAAAPTVAPYGEVSRFGGFDEKAAYGPSTTSGLEAGKLVYPVGMTVDSSDPSVPLKNGYAIYVLDLLNPQAMNALKGAHPEPVEKLSLEYRLQKFGSAGEVLASQQFTLTSTTSIPGLHATAVAVDGTTDKVYVLLADVPPTELNLPEYGEVASYSLEAWSAGRNQGEQALAPATREVVAGPGTLQPGGLSTPATMIGDVRGESLTVDDVSGKETTVAIAGNEYPTPQLYETKPVIERITTGAHAGSIVSTKWGSPEDIEDSENAVAKLAPAGRSSSIYATSANPDGSLNTVLGNREGPEPILDEEPNMATVNGELTQTTAILPWASANEVNHPNLDRSATTFLYQRSSSANPYEYSRIVPSGATTKSGSLVPSVVQLSQEQAPSGVYAGVVAHEPDSFGGIDPQSGMPYSWVFAGSAGEPEITSVTSASLGIRLFDAQGESLGMIGNVTAGGTCNLQGGAYRFNTPHISFVALVAGADGILFALVQPDLNETSDITVAPGAPVAKTIEHPLEHVQGDQVIEFAPNAGSNNASGWKECPQPEGGGFSITEEASKGGTGTPKIGNEVTVYAGSTLKFESEANLKGGSPWAYDWNLGNGQEINNEWVSANEWLWPSPKVEDYKYATPGKYTVKLDLVNDFGKLETQRVVNVVQAKPITNAKIAVGGSLNPGQPVSFTASETLPEFDSIVEYHWEFGDGSGDDQPTSNKDQHEYTTPGPYTVKVTLTDALGQKAEATETITIANPPTKEPTKEPESKTIASITPVITPPTIIPPTIAPPPAKPVSKPPLTRAQKLANALKACKKQPKKHRAACEKQAKKKYAPPTKTTKKKKK